MWINQCISGKKYWKKNSVLVDTVYMPETVLKKRVVSPPSPSCALSICLKDAERLYKQYGHSHFTRGELASTLALSAKSGPFRQRVASLKMYNLVSVASGQSLAISETFERIHFADKHSPDYRQAVHASITHPSIFKTILDKFNEQFPDTETIAKYLETDLGFNHKTAVRTANILRATLAQTGLIDAKNNMLSVRDEYSQPVSSHNHPSGTAPPSAAVQTLTAQIPVSGGNVVTIQYPQKISAQDADKITQVLSALTHTY